MSAQTTCAVAGCAKPRKGARELCGMHAERVRHHGTTDLLPKPTSEERFWAKVDKTGDCWLWTAKLINTGYGSFLLDGKMQLAHRISFVWAHGSIADGLVLDHLCRVKNCVNPAHLEAVSQRENTRRGMSPGALAYRLNACGKGHALTPENTYLDGKKGWRKCRECTLAARRTRDRRRRGEAA